MNCKETQKYIMDFLKDDLKDEVTEAFLDHVSDCKECMEELTIQYLVTEGLQRLETGSAFDAQKELRQKIQDTIVKRRLQKRIRISLFAIGMSLALVFVAVIAVWFAI